MNDLLSLEKSTARQTIIPTLASSLSRNAQSVDYLSDLFEESAMHGMTRQPFLVEVSAEASFKATEAFKFGRTVPSCTNQLKRFSVFEMQEDNRDTGEKAAFHAVTKESCETDGHNTDIKSRRESAMRAGEPSACITPDSEAQAQLRGVHS
jgi:hypothetical protein